MIKGYINEDGTPAIELMIGGQLWQATIDTGFNSDLELPEDLRVALQPQWKGKIYFLLGGGQGSLQDSYDVTIVFDGEIRSAEATFNRMGTFLIGTRFLRHYRLEVNFVSGAVTLEKCDS